MDEEVRAATLGVITLLAGYYFKTRLLLGIGFCALLAFFLPFFLSTGELIAGKGWVLWKFLNRGVLAFSANLFIICYKNIENQNVRILIFHVSQLEQLKN